MREIKPKSLTKGHNYSPKRIEWGKDEVYVLPKLNGLRIDSEEDGIFSYDGKHYSEIVIPHLYKILGRAYRLYERVLDGELYVHGWSLQQVNKAGAVKRVKPRLEFPCSAKLQFHVFDVVWNKPYLERNRLYHQIVKSLNSDFVKAVKCVRINSKKEADLWYREFVRQGYEGAIYRINDRRYEFGRHWHVLKRKEWQDDEFKVVGSTEEVSIHGEPKGRMGALICVTKSGKRFKVGTGFEDWERELYWRKKPIGKKLKVKYLCLSDEGIPLNLSSLGIREQG